jgi:hypothetical protein
VPRGAANAVRTGVTGRPCGCRLGLLPLLPSVHSRTGGHRQRTSTSTSSPRRDSPPTRWARGTGTETGTEGKQGKLRSRSARQPPTRPDLTVLALESSADDSCAAIVTSSREILANVVIKQHHINARYGGIHPIKAQDAHAYGVVSGVRDVSRLRRDCVETAPSCVETASSSVEIVSRLRRDCVETVSNLCSWRCPLSSALSSSPNPPRPTVTASHDILPWRLATTTCLLSPAFFSLFLPFSFPTTRRNAIRGGGSCADRYQPHAIRLALSHSRLSLAAIDAIAFTRGPGMYGCLTVCAASAKAMAAATGKPLIGVHHMVSAGDDWIA